MSIWQSLVMAWCLLVAVCAFATPSGESPATTTTLMPFRVLVDQQRTLSREDALQFVSKGAFQPVSGDQFIGKTLDSRYWFSMALTGSDVERVLFMEHFPTEFSALAWWLLDEEGNVVNHRFHHWLTQDKAIPWNDFWYAMAIPPGHQNWQVIGYAENDSNGLPARLRPQLADREVYSERAIHNNITLVVFYACMAILFLYNLFLFLSLRESTYGMYLLVMAGAMLMLALMDGTLYFPGEDYPKHKWLSLLGLAFSFSYAGFIYFALDKVTFWPAFNKYLRWLAACAVVVVALRFLSDRGEILYLVQAGLFSVMMLSITAVIKGCRRGIMLAWYMVSAELAYILFGYFYNSVLNGYLPEIPAFKYGLYLGSLLEATLLSFALGARTRQLMGNEVKAREQALVSARQAMKARNEFLSTISHELRTPLASVIGFADILAERKWVAAEGMPLLDKIRHAGHRLNDTVDEMLQVSLLSAQKVQPMSVPTDMEQLLLQVYRHFMPLAAQSGINLNLEIQPSHGLVVKIDGGLLSQALHPLLDNALRFTREGGVSLCFTLAANERTMEIMVVDTGPGIPQDRLDALLQPFTQVDSSDARLHGGTGVGLYLARNFTELLQGQMRVKSAPGQGTRITLSLPCERTTAAAEAWMEAEGPAVVPKLDGELLFAEDNPDNQQMIRMLVEATGARLVLVGNGREAVEAVATEPDRYRLVLMDIQMPVMDGVQALKALREAGHALPVIAFSASALHVNPVYANAGFDGFLAKPVDVEKLYRLLGRYLHAAEEKRQDVISGDQATAATPAHSQGLEHLQRKFVASLPSKLERLEASFHAADDKTLSGLLHQLKGSAGTYGHDTLSRLCSLAEVDLSARQRECVGGHLQAMRDYLQSLDNGASP